MGTTLKRYRFVNVKYNAFNSAVFTSDEQCFDILNEVATNRGSSLQCAEENSFDKGVLSEVFINIRKH